MADEVRNLYRPTFPEIGRIPFAPLARRFTFFNRQFVLRLAADFPGYADLVHQRAEQSLVHCFDLLGSGPSVVTHGVSCRGIEGVSYAMPRPIEIDRTGRWLKGRINRANLGEAQRIWQLAGESYTPIDWQLDFKSGYRWREDAWHRDIRFGHLMGVDVKVPWELGRMQHLPTLALACHFADTGLAGFKDSSVYAQEFRSQVLDFIATNPPGFGVNWACAMDVAIRAANLLVARDIVVASGVQFDEAFEAVFAASIVAHGRHIAANLEWSPQVRGNHYLANIVGLLFAAAYLPSSDEVDAWLAFAVQELLTEIAYQFHEDGSNFEASVCYHRLSAEMLLWAFALLSDLAREKCAVLMRPQRHPTLPRLRANGLTMYRIAGTDRESPVPDWCWARLAKMAAFTQAMTRPDGLVVQFGDNDSGRFITLGSGEQLRAGNDPAAPVWSLDHGALIAGIRAILGGVPDSSSAQEDAGARILRAFAGFDGDPDPVLVVSPGCDSRACAIGDNHVWMDSVRRFEETAPASRWVCTFDASSPGLLDGLQLSAFPGMGCYVFRSPRFYLAIRCGEIGLSGLGAHAHCDQLAIELVIDGETRVRDPGTLIYTPFPTKRNAYRSVRAHHVPRVAGREPADLDRGLFDLRGAAEGECLYFGPRGFVGRHAGYGPSVYRIISLDSSRIVIRDFADGALPLADPAPERLSFSPSYGRVLA
ncbi:MAG: heparinase II/III family protein [Rhodocyclaceae bacterium]|nr:heparinase II/III family protein [Rhodocyclaceae bacterium]